MRFLVRRENAAGGYVYLAGTMLDSISRTREIILNWRPREQAIEFGSEEGVHATMACWPYTPYEIVEAG